MTSVRRETGKRNKKAPNPHKKQQRQRDSGNEASMAAVLAELRAFRKEQSEAAKDTKDKLARVETALSAVLRTSTSNRANVMTGADLRSSLHGDGEGTSANTPGCSRLTLSALRLLVSPIRLVSAAVWQTIQKKVVANYGMLEEFVSTVTDIVPELLTTRQKVQLSLGLRARLILELCQFEATADFEAVCPHLDRMQNHIEAWLVEAGATKEEVPNSDFVDVVKNILKDPEKRGDFFQKVFPEKFGATFDEALHTLTWLLLSRLEKLLPLQPFQQVASMFDEASPVLEDCLESVSQYEELRVVLRYQKDLSQLDPNDPWMAPASLQHSNFPLQKQPGHRKNKHKPPSWIMCCQVHQMWMRNI
ncbi:uncharacterized protein LOC133027703 [Limanda limanda]|uniref:uncharacterized protein LOC133027703 n=1 Tax=Limanda limanda TaxID=27771 RepID=UPI0029C7DC91|nr:uncharacterized protein LOC133027703 [Limanda limanda]